MLLHTVDEVLVKVHLSDVRGCRVDEGVVGLRLGVDVCHDVDVCCAAGVVAGEDGFELDYAVSVGLLYAAEERGFPVGWVCRAGSVVLVDNAAVYTG